MMNSSELLSPARRWLALQRVTALWAFGESGLGGMLHAFKLPFTGLIVGSFAVICITLIGWLSAGHTRRITESLLLVLIIKAIVSPHSPPTAYLAVSFQALCGYVLFSIGGVRSWSVFALALLAMVESALQKVLTLTFFFGQSFWAAIDELFAYIGRELRVGLPPGSGLLIGLYLGLYVLGGLISGWISWRLVCNFMADAGTIPEYRPHFRNPAQPARRTGIRRTVFVTGGLLALCLLIYLLPGPHEQKRQAVVRTLLWTGAALLAWYGLLAPVLLRVLHRFLKQKQAENARRINDLLFLLPALRQVSVAAWIQSGETSGWRRIPCFLRLFIHWSLTSDSVELQEQAA